MPRRSRIIQRAGGDSASFSRAEEGAGRGNAFSVLMRRKKKNDDGGNTTTVPKTRGKFRFPLRRKQKSSGKQFRRPHGKRGVDRDRQTYLEEQEEFRKQQLDGLGSSQCTLSTEEGTVSPIRLDDLRLVPSSDRVESVEMLLGVIDEEAEYDERVSKYAASVESDSEGSSRSDSDGVSDDENDGVEQEIDDRDESDRPFDEMMNTNDSNFRMPQKPLNSQQPKRDAALEEKVGTLRTGLALSRGQSSTINLGSKSAELETVATILDRVNVCSGTPLAEMRYVNSYDKNSPSMLGAEGLSGSSREVSPFNSSYSKIEGDSPMMMQKTSPDSSIKANHPKSPNASDTRDAPAPLALTPDSQIPFDERSDRDITVSKARSGDEMIARKTESEKDAKMKTLAISTVERKLVTPEAIGESKVEATPQQTVTKRLIDAFNCTDPCNAISLDFQGSPTMSPSPDTPATVKLSSPKRMQWIELMRSAPEFAHEMVHFGFPLVHHRPSADPKRNTEEMWVGRSVCMTLCPGVVSDSQIVHPRLEWSILGNGRSKKLSISLREVLSVTARPSGAAGELTRDGYHIVEEDGGDILCFFTITMVGGDVHVFESVTQEESHRLVNGIKSLNPFLSSQVIRGDTSVLELFYKPDGQTTDEAMLQLSMDHFE